MTDAERRAAWLKLYDNGLSSQCIADVMCGWVPGGDRHRDHPRDAGDFGRCERLLTAWRTRHGLGRAWHLETRGATVEELTDGGAQQ